MTHPTMRLVLHGTCAIRTKENHDMAMYRCALTLRVAYFFTAYTDQRQAAVSKRSCSGALKQSLRNVKTSQPLGLVVNV